jgi:hypothetical protein
MRKPSSGPEERLAGCLRTGKLALTPALSPVEREGASTIWKIRWLRFQSPFFDFPTSNPKKQTMTKQQREQIRLSILRYCDCADEFGLSEPLLLQFLRSEGFRALSAAKLHAEIIYLADKTFLASVPKLISPENPAWRITASGRDFFAIQNSAQEEQP